jgi:hypothetical protein
MRRFLSLRWLGLHAAMVIIVVGFLALGWWQLTRAEGGNALSWGYTFEWPLFAGFVVVFWIKAMRDELHEAQARDRAQAPDRAQGPPAERAVPVSLPAGLRTSGGAALDGDGEGEQREDEELAAYNAYLGRLNAEASRTTGRLAGRASRRQAAGWATRRDSAARHGGQRAGEAAKQSAPGSPPHLEV